MTSSFTTRHTYLGLFLVTLATLMYETLLSRIFSVTMYYHFAFMAVSVAMFGMTVGAILVYLFPHLFDQERIHHHLAQNTLLFAITAVLALVLHMLVPFSFSLSWQGIASLLVTYAGIAVPFTFSGICVSLLLTRFPKEVSKLYAADLAGAAVGCIVLIFTLRITDGPTAVVVVALLASSATLLFAQTGSPLKRTALLATGIFALFVVVNTTLIYQNSNLLQLIWVKGRMEATPVHERWNSFSRIIVHEHPEGPGEPSGWGMSHTYPGGRDVNELYMNIDANAATTITEFDGNLENIRHLEYDVTNIVHSLRSDAKVLVIGIGGGRDVLSSLLFKQKEVVGVEINEDIIETVTTRFGDFTGHLDEYPNVRFVNDEARSYIARQDERFDIIQASLIDTWAATSAGAFVLTENSLYTRDAWNIFLNHLTDRGVLTFSRWYVRNNPGETYRLTALASASLIDSGIANPRDHIMLVRLMGVPISGDGRFGGELDNNVGVSTILVSKEPFTAQEVATIEEVCERLEFDMILSPNTAMDETLETIAEGQELVQLIATYPQNIAPPTDDSPFFFQMLRVRDMFNPDTFITGHMGFNAQAVAMLGILLLIVTALTLLCIFVPLILTTKQAPLKGNLTLFLFFASIGFGFMLVEIAQMQRLIVFLGHPSYSLSVVLFTLLLASGLGSFFTERVTGNKLKTTGGLLLLALVVSLVLTGLITPVAVKAFQASTTPLRILVAIGLLAIPGLCMGMAFPLGMKQAATRSLSLTPWLWGINGATSVVASVIAIVLALSAGIAFSFWVGCAWYVVALGAFAMLTTQSELHRH